MVTVYSKKNCQGCRATVRFLESRGIEFHYKDVEERPELVSYLASYGFSSLPVVDTGKDVWSGYRPDLLGGLVG